MASYTISDIEKLTGIKAHTLRMWEKRYSLIEPERTPSNIRLYNDNHLRYILNISFLRKNGYKISAIAEMDSRSLERKVEDLTKENREQVEIDSMMRAMIHLDEFAFDSVFTEKVEHLGFKTTMLKVIYPLLEKLSIMWVTGAIKPVQQTFMSYTIKQKIIAAIDKVEFKPHKNTKSFLLFLPNHEAQELSMLFMHYLIKAQGHKTLNLGLGITTLDLYEAKKIYTTDYVFTMINEKMERYTTQEYVDELQEIFLDTKILLSGYQIIQNPINTKENVQILNSLNDMIKYLNKINV